MGLWGTEKKVSQPLSLREDSVLLLEIVATDQNFMLYANGNLFVSIITNTPTSEVKHIQLSPDFEIQCSRVEEAQNLRGLTCFWESFERQRCFQLVSGQLPYMCPDFVTPTYLTKADREPCGTMPNHYCQVTCKGRLKWHSHRTDSGEPKNHLVNMPRGAYGVGVPARSKRVDQFSYKGHFFRQTGNGQEQLSNRALQTLLLYGFNLRGLECGFIQSNAKQHRITCFDKDEAGNKVFCPNHVTPAYLSVGIGECQPNFEKRNQYCIVSCVQGSPKRIVDSIQFTRMPFKSIKLPSCSPVSFPMTLIKVPL